MYKIGFYIPEEHLEPVKQAMFDAGAGRFDNYEQACWQVKGEGQFKPIGEANPHTGEVGRLERLPEYRVEMLCPEELLQNVLNAMREAHPYEEPAYDVVQLVDC